MTIEIKNVTVQVSEKLVLNDFSLTIGPSQVHAIMGPNGTGKSTLSKVILGNPSYVVQHGDILVDGKSILSLSTDERARLGIFLSMQNPISIDGVKVSEFLRTALSSRGEHQTVFQFVNGASKALDDLHMPHDMLYRSLNQGFSGGEKKKNEILQMKLLKPQFIILDEVDSGLDIDSLKVVCDNINQYLKEYPNTSLLIITHYPRILEYLVPDQVHVMMDGKIVKTGDLSLAYTLEKEGYQVGMNTISELNQNA